jgi:GNAT superfamily N-acetyltransferase
VPGADEAWTIGLVVGPSGSGKTTVARRAFGASLLERSDWPWQRAVVDCFGDLPTRDVVGLLTAVGFSSPPSWIKPYRVLSGGERFRCDLARALAAAWQAGSRATEGARPIVAFDEFTSVVDRNVAQIGSAAVSKAIRGGRIPCRFVAVTCHYDVAEWLEPDWVVDVAERACVRRRLRRPAIELELARAKHRLWRLFAPHHYLTGSLSKTVRCYAAWWKGEPVSFCATMPVIGRRNHWRITRIVTLPDYQGVGIGTRLAEAVCDLHRAQGHRINVTASHPALLAHCQRSHRWRVSRVQKGGTRRTARFIDGYRSSGGRAVVSFEYLGDR